MKIELTNEEKIQIREFLTHREENNFILKFRGKQYKFADDDFQDDFGNVWSSSFEEVDGKESLVLFWEYDGTKEESNGEMKDSFWLENVKMEIEV